MLQPEVLSKDEISKMLGEITQRELEIAKKAHLTELYDLVLFEGESGRATVRDIMGRKFIDCTAQAWSLNVGYVQRDVIFAVSEQMKRLTHVRYGFPTIPRLKLAKKLIEISPEGLKKVSFNNEGGSLAIEAALKLAMINTKASNFIVTKTGYHGSTLSTLKASQEMPLAIRFKAFGSERFEKINFPYCYRCPYDMKEKECSLECARELEKILEESEKKFAGFLIEPMQGPAGQIPVPKEYLKEVRRICSENNVLLIFDESQTAFGRCGEMFASFYYKVEPDLMCLTKALGGGFPIGATLAREDLVGFTPAEEHTTFGSNPIMFAAALINIEVCERLRLPEKARKRGAHITRRLKELSESYEMIGDVRGPGLFIGVELVKNASRKRAIHEMEDFIKLGFKKGVIFGRSMPDERAGMIYDDRMITGGNVVKIKPPLVITEEEADFVLQVFEECLKTLKG